jgi:hypothetical protein
MNALSFSPCHLDRAVVFTEILGAKMPTLLNLHP